MYSTYKLFSHTNTDFTELIQVYALITTVCVVCLLNYYMFRSFYTEFDDRFRSTLEVVKQRMMEANGEMEAQLRDRVIEGEEPQNLLDFGKAWREKLQKLRELEEEKEGMNGHIVFLYYLLVFSLVFAVFNLLNPGPVIQIFGTAIHLCFFGWVFTVMAGVLLILNQRAYLKLNSSLKENQTVIIKVSSAELEEEDLQVYRIHAIQDEPAVVEQ